MSIISCDACAGTTYYCFCARQVDALLALGMKGSVDPAVLLDTAWALDASAAADDAAVTQGAALLL